MNIQATGDIDIDEHTILIKVQYTYTDTLQKFEPQIYEPSKFLNLTSVAKQIPRVPSKILNPVLSKYLNPTSSCVFQMW